MWCYQNSHKCVARFEKFICCNLCKQLRCLIARVACTLISRYFYRYGSGGFGSRDYRQYQNRGNQNQGGFRGAHDHNQGFGGNRGGYGGYNSGGYNNFVQHHNMSRGAPGNARPAVNDWFDSSA